MCFFNEHDAHYYGDILNGTSQAHNSVITEVVICKHFYKL